MKENKSYFRKMMIKVGEKDWAKLLTKEEEKLSPELKAELTSYRLWLGTIEACSNDLDKRLRRIEKQLKKENNTRNTQL